MPIEISVEDLIKRIQSAVAGAGIISLGLQMSDIKVEVTAKGFFRYSIRKRGIGAMSSLFDTPPFNIKPNREEGTITFYDGSKDIDEYIQYSVYIISEVVNAYYSEYKKYYGAKNDYKKV